MKRRLLYLKIGGHLSNTRGQHVAFDEEGQSPQDPVGADEEEEGSYYPIPFAKTPKRKRKKAKPVA